MGCGPVGSTALGMRTSVPSGARLVVGASGLDVYVNAVRTVAFQQAYTRFMNSFVKRDSSDATSKVEITETGASFAYLTTVMTSSAVLQFQERAVPTAPAADNAFLFTRENAGTAELVAQWSDASVDVLASGPVD